MKKLYVKCTKMGNDLEMSFLCCNFTRFLK